LLGCFSQISPPTDIGEAQAIGHVLLSLVLQERAEKAGAEIELRKALARNPRAMRLAIREAQLDIARAHQ